MEALRLKAESGDVNSMLQLANVYFNDGEYFKSDEWYSKATENGSVQGFLLSLIVKITLGYAGMQIDVKIDDSHVKEWEENYSWATKWYDSICVNIDEEQNKQILEKIEEIKYYLALNYYFADRFEDVLKLTEQSDAVKSSILYAISIVELDFLNDDNLKMAFNKLCIIDNNKDYGGAPKGVWEERAYVLGAGLLSELYNLGLDGSLTSDINGSFRVLYFVKSQLKEQTSIRIIDEHIKTFEESVETTDEADEVIGVNKAKKTVSHTVLCVNCGNKVNAFDENCPICGGKIECEVDGDVSDIIYGGNKQPEQDGRIKRAAIIVSVFSFLIIFVIVIISVHLKNENDSYSAKYSIEGDSIVENTYDYYDQYNYPEYIDIPNDFFEIDNVIYTVNVAKGDNLPLREGPNADSKKISGAERGEFVEVVGKSADFENWWLIYWEGENLYGWVNNDFLTEGTDIGEYSDRYIVDVEDGDNLPLRNGPSVYYEKILGLHRGEYVYVYGRSDDYQWCLVYHENSNNHGWVNRDYLTESFY